ncbi:MAG: hypothetical protein WCX71_05355 [Candidatus Buchananbacteria bacterium]
MDNFEAKNLKHIIKKEIEIEDSMIILYSGILNSDYLEAMSENDKDLVVGIINGLLRDTRRHKKTMEEIISKL